MTLPEAAQPPRTAHTPPHDTGLARQVDEAIARALAEQRIVGTVVLVARAGQVVYRRAAGLADREAARPMQDDTHFLLASVTKPIVAAAVMRLVDQGVAAFDDPVTRWLPGFRPRTAHGTEPVITLQQLLTHTAGLTYPFLEAAGHPYHRLRVSSGLDQPCLSLDENLRRLAAAPLWGLPGAAWKYSMAFDVLGAVIERACGRPLPEAVQALVTRPLGMADTGFGVADRHRLATPYGDARPRPVRMGREHTVVFNGLPIRFEPERVFDPASYPSGGAGMVGTAHDTLLLLEALRTGGHGFLRADTAAGARQLHVGPQAQTKGPGWGYGRGYAVLADPVAAQSPQSAGTLSWGGVYGHSWFIDPARQLTVVAMTNTALEGMTGRFTTELRDAVYGVA
ncbi:MAG: beta-lactamase family protein [Rhizobacter sp.]|nr:beta-lactamase family protein [Rhizobacter sp.]